MKEFIAKAVREQCEQPTTDWATSHCVECPFRESEKFNYAKAAGFANFKEWREFLDPIVSAQPGSFSCHMRRRMHCFGAQEVQPVKLEVIQ